MARYINCFELKQRILEERNQIPSERNVHNNAIRCGIRKALRCLEQCQSVNDVVSVVRCKDCKNYAQIKSLGMGQCWKPMGITNFVHDNDFCSYGERKEK